MTPLGIDFALDCLPRFFFPWPKQPHQCYCETSERVALQRRHPPDDAFIVPHNLYLTGLSKTFVLNRVVPFCFSVLAAFKSKSIRLKHKTKHVLKQNARFGLPRIQIPVANMSCRSDIR